MNDEIQAIITSGTTHLSEGINDGLAYWNAEAPFKHERNDVFILVCDGDADKDYEGDTDEISYNIATSGIDKVMLVGMQGATMSNLENMRDKYNNVAGRTDFAMTEDLTYGNFKTKFTELLREELAGISESKETEDGELELGDMVIDADHPLTITVDGDTRKYNSIEETNGILVIKNGSLYLNAYALKEEFGITDWEGVSVSITYYTD